MTAGRHGGLITALATIALLLLAFSAVSGRLERSIITPAIFFTSAGLLAGR